MDMIDKVLATAAVNDMEFSAPIRSSLLVAKQTLNRYYHLTDDSDLYHIAMNMVSLISATSFHVNNAFQSFIQYTRLSTSNELNGRPVGLTMPRPLFDGFLTRSTEVDMKLLQKI